MGCAGNDEIHTPHLDGLADRGIHFSRFFCTSPVCSPARASLFTGELPSQHAVHDWLSYMTPGVQASTSSPDGHSSPTCWRTRDTGSASAASGTWAQTTARAGASSSSSGAANSARSDEWVGSSTRLRCSPVTQALEDLRRQHRTRPAQVREALAPLAAPAHLEVTERPTSGDESPAQGSMYGIWIGRTTCLTGAVTAERVWSDVNGHFPETGCYPRRGPIEALKPTVVSRHVV
ncbi:sulfatase-like hydrolase/transferase [Streptomyces sp. NBC_01362]|uniref:sulfatase-like hydrolase/transferase n=1 Tax=Streptomyces sp. NBC_01362 TaxID=2903839 RepID=UPI003FCE936E